MNGNLTGYRCWAATHVGRLRNRNEDAIGLPGLADVRSASWTSALAERSWAVVTDGMGGHAAGEVASELAVAMFVSIAPQLKTPGQVANALSLIHKELRSAAERHPEFRGMGTTIAGVLLRPDGCITFHLGDSRIYQLTGGGLKQIGKDHALDGGLIGYLGGSSRTLVRSPEIHQLGLSPGDSLLLCTDGLTGMVNDSEIAAVLQASPDPARELVNCALAGGGHDNITAVVIKRDQPR